MDKMKIKKLFQVFTIIFASFMLLTACTSGNKDSEAKLWDSKTKTYTDDVVKMTYIKTRVHDIEYNAWEENKDVDLKTINLDGKDRIAVRVYWKLENNSGSTISFKRLYAHAINGIPSVSSVTQGGKKKTLVRITASAWPIEEGYDKSHEDLKPGESVKTFDTYILDDTTTPIVIYFNKYGEDKSEGSYKISWEGSQITTNQLTMDAINNSNKMAETNKKKEADIDDKITKVFDGIAVDKDAKSTWTKADYDALVKDYGSGTKLTDIIAKYPHPSYKYKDGGDISLQYGKPEGDNFVSLSFQRITGTSDFELVSKKENGLK
ncbi:hypothetical protein [Clostridium felsineum]|uniref:Uncharacterized protein n=1 Tax=Clostridium felsineum TaxID=36839 RepID=A0A1S8LQ14_9CLOT|nr:hypothetical protein [Clostridium felsineum]URZ08624.1 hypothetical protein CLROS_040060 [Clostridium felsineum]URZ13655.1 hypothetical protein CROST_044210 [Clostridium felsineum]